MSSDGSITRWFNALQAGNRDAVQPLWQRFATRLIGLARKRLAGAACRAADEEDAVLSAFESFCRGAEEGRLPQFHDRGELWNLLAMITVRKVCDYVTRERRQKRGGGVVYCEVDLADLGNEHQALDDLISCEPTPQMATEMAEQCHRLLGALPDPELRSIALWKMEGYTNVEIAEKLDYARGTIQRKLSLIQARWEQELMDPNS